MAYPPMTICGSAAVLTPPYTPDEGAILDEGSKLVELLDLPATPPRTPIEQLDDEKTAFLHWSAFDLDKPMSALLREATSIAHETVMRSPIVDLLITGQIPRDLHVRYLVALYNVYTALEEALALHCADDHTSHIYNPALFSRAEAIGDDIVLLTGDVHWRKSLVAVEMGSLQWPELADYVKRLRSVSAGEQIGSPLRDVVYAPPAPRPHLLLGHAYVRYMGDLSGGQSIGKAVAEAYGLALEDLNFYRFGTLEDPSGAATASDNKRTKARFRKGLDKAAERLTSRQKAELMQEANHAFELNVRLFSSFGRLLDQSVPEPVILPLARPSLRSKAATYAPTRHYLAKMQPETAVVSELPARLVLIAAVAIGGILLIFAST